MGKKDNLNVNDSSVIYLTYGDNLKNDGGIVGEKKNKELEIDLNIGPDLRTKFDDGDLRHDIRTNLGVSGGKKDMEVEVGNVGGGIDEPELNINLELNLVTRTRMHNDGVQKANVNVNFKPNIRTNYGVGGGVEDVEVKVGNIDARI